MAIFSAEAGETPALQLSQPLGCRVRYSQSQCCRIHSHTPFPGGWGCLQGVIMPTIRRFVVVPAVPEKLQGLNELAFNVWTLWNYDAASLFRRLDVELWEATNHNPVKLLSLIAQ